MYYLTYDLGRYNDESVCEEFETEEELLEAYNDLDYEACEIKAWKDDERIAPWIKIERK